MNKYILIIFCSLFIVSAQAQDAHYSHFYLTPLYLNPALTGDVDGGQRIGGSYRSQWANIPAPYTTYGLFYDKSTTKFNWGVVLNQNSAGEASLKTTNVLLSGAYRKQLSFLKQNYLAIGAQVGFAQKRFDPTQFAFDSQYSPDNGYNPNLSNQESFNRTTAILPDINVGALWNFGFAQSAQGQIGLSFAHLTSPTSSFYYSSQFSYPLRTTIHGQVMLPVSLKLTLNPKVLWMRQSPANELLFGLNGIYKVSDDIKVGAGVMTRRADALIVQGHLEYQNFIIGVSYDANVSSLQPSSNGNGAIEVDVIYKLGQFKGKAPIDTDKDGIYDHKDKCPLVPGIKALKGCPATDKDGDGILDHEDRCPDVPGIAALRGCPQQNPADSDGDGILDKDDKCPTVPGIPALQGCPQQQNPLDSDGDGILDKDDLCPTVPGVIALQGCPEDNKLKDSDGDGIADHIDVCPFQPGTLANQGCNDTDGDGVWDHIDICPRIFGEKTNNGCPANNQNLDSDGDGILDKVDKCVYLRGELKHGGCPDSDKDGVSDIEDDCPFIKGSITNSGCPEENTEVPTFDQPREIRTALVEFDTDKSFIRPYYFPMLDEIAAFMRNNPSYSIVLSGHTDSEGNQAYNYQLSQRRTQAVHDYLVSKGVLPQRIEQRGYGEVVPKSNNASVEGKQRNRRTEITIIGQ